MEPTIFWGDCLRMARVSKRLTQKEIAAVLHISRQTYSTYETGRAHPSPEIIAILSNIYEVNLFDYAIQCLPSDYIAEQTEFKYNIPSEIIVKEQAESSNRTPRKKKVKYIQKDANITKQFFCK